MELNFKDEDKLIELLKSFNYRFNIMINKDYSDVKIIDYSDDMVKKLEEYDNLKEELEEAEERIEDLESEVSELEDRIYDLEH